MRKERMMATAAEKSEASSRGAQATIGMKQLGYLKGNKSCAFIAHS
jgi:hypothetical protein